MTKNRIIVVLYLAVLLPSFCPSPQLSFPLPFILTAFIIQQHVEQLMERLMLKQTLG